MKIGVISDLHMNTCSGGLPQKLLDGLKGLDMLLVAGDIGDACVLHRLKAICPQIKAVWGNMDSDPLRSKLPEKEVFQAGSHTIGLVHGYGHPAHLIETVTKLFAGEKVDVIVFGHAHYPVNETHNGVLFFNPGSPTDKTFAPYNSYGILEINGNIKAEVIKI